MALPSNLSRTGLKDSYYDPKKTAGPDFQKTKQGIMDASAQTSEALKGKYAAARRKVAGQQREGERQIGKGLSRLEAISGGTGGATEKARLTATKQLGQQSNEATQGITASEAESTAKLNQMTTQATTALDEAERARSQQREQFKSQMSFQRDGLAAEFEFKWAEFDENLRTNATNSIIAFKEAGLKNAKDWDGIMEMINVTGYGSQYNTSGVRAGAEDQRARERAWMQNVMGGNNQNNPTFGR